MCGWPWGGKAQLCCSALHPRDCPPSLPSPGRPNHHVPCVLGLWGYHVFRVIGTTCTCQRWRCAPPVGLVSWSTLCSMLLPNHTPPMTQGMVDALPPSIKIRTTLRVRLHTTSARPGWTGCAGMVVPSSVASVPPGPAPRVTPSIWHAPWLCQMLWQHTAQPGPQHKAATNLLVLTRPLARGGSCQPTMLLLPCSANHSTPPAD